MKKNKQISLWIFILFLSIFSLISTGRFGGDGLENYLTAESIVLDRDFAIHVRPFEIEEMRHARNLDVETGKPVYSQYGLAVAFLLVPFYLAGYLLSVFLNVVPRAYVTQFTVSFFNPVVLAFLSVALFRLLASLGYTEKISFFTTGVYSLCTFNIVYARSGFSEPLVALLVVIAASGFLSYSREGKMRYLMISSAAIAFAIFIKKNSLLLLPPFGVYFLFFLIVRREGGMRKNLSHVLCFALPLALSGIAILMQNNILYGGALITEHGTIDDMARLAQRDGDTLKGIYYYLVSSGKGYLIYNVALVLGLFSIKDFFVKRRSYCLMILAILLVNLLFYSSIFIRGSLFSWGPRYLFPTLPLFSLFLAEFMARKNSVRRKLTIGFFALAGFMVQLPSLLMNSSKFLFFVKEKLFLDEYLINFMPELSPIRGVWVLFLSAVKRFFTGSSLMYSYNPDPWFFETISASLSGYDIVDVWWVNVLRVESRLFPAVLICVLMLIVLIMFSAIKIIAALYFDGTKKGAA